jgi:pimeloyl-ACP methyl ester carboxylesterase
MRVLRPDEFFPAGHPGVSAQTIIAADGMQVRVAASGNENGKPLLAFHGWGNSLYAFRFLFAPLAAAGYRFLAVDLKGHGLSSKPTEAREYTLESLSNHALHVADALGLSRFDILAHSMGARVAVELLLRQPHRVERLYLVNPVGFGPMPHVSFARIIAWRPVAQLLPSPLPSRLVRIPVSVVYGNIGKPSDRDVEEYRAPTQFREFLIASTYLLRFFDWRVLSDKSLSQVRERSAVVVGELDRVVRVVRDGLHRKYLDENWDLRVVPNVAHVVHEEAPDEIVKMVRGRSPG